MARDHVARRGRRPADRVARRLQGDYHAIPGVVEASRSGHVGADEIAEHDIVAPRHLYVYKVARYDVARPGIGPADRVVGAADKYPREVAQSLSAPAVGAYEVALHEIA